MQNRRNGSVSRKLTLLVISVAVLAVFSLAAVPSAKASVTYQLKLTDPGNSTYSGTGSFTLNQTPSNSSSTQDYTFGGSNTFPSGDLLSLSLTIDNVTFNASGCNLQFNSGTLNNIYGCSFTASGSNPPNINNIQLGATGYSLNANPNNSGTSGTVTASLVTPEPSTLLLWGTGLLALGAIFRKKLGVGSAV